MKTLRITCTAICCSIATHAAEIHVSVQSGSDSNNGAQATPLKSISAAASKAMPGDTVTVHAGIYRECVNPPRGGSSDRKRITYQAAPGEKVVITGAEAVKGWTHLTNDTWKVVIPNSYFGDFNPFTERVHGEWCSSGPLQGTVYLDGDWFDGAVSKVEVLKPAGAKRFWHVEVGGTEIPAITPHLFTHIPGTDTTLWAQFKGVNPNEANVEINVRQSVFYPSKPGVNYITVRGFELRQAATPWAGAMSEQIGLIGTHWSKGWMIENNIIHHSIATGVTLGRYELPKHEFPPVTAPGFVESVELALRDGWSKEKIGSHIVRNNHISHCEKNAIHGSLGSPFSEISGNEIHDIANRGWIVGPDTAGIKFLGGVDMIIRDNHIHHCGGAAGIWLDWMAQGTQVTGNLLHDNSQDIFFEMQHGPLLSANNILLSPESQLINSEGLALAHNLIAGATRNISDPRATPFHHAHALTVAGLYAACGGDHRVHNNIFAGGWNILGKLPNVASGNLFIGAAKPLPFDPAPAIETGFNPQLEITRKDDGWHLAFNADPAWSAAAKCKLVTTELLGKAKIPNLPYENADGSQIRVDTDYFGKPRNPQNPFPGPFETPVNGEIKVWPK